MTATAMRCALRATRCPLKHFPLIDPERQAYPFERSFSGCCLHSPALVLSGHSMHTHFHSGCSSSLVRVSCPLLTEMFATACSRLTPVLLSQMSAVIVPRSSKQRSYSGCCIMRKRCSRGEIFAFCVFTEKSILCVHKSLIKLLGCFAGIILF